MSAYLLRVEDDVVAGGDRRIEKGDWVLVDPAREVRPGDIVHAIEPNTDRDIVSALEFLPRNGDGQQRSTILGVVTERRTVFD